MKKNLSLSALLFAVALIGSPAYAAQGAQNPAPQGTPKPNQTPQEAGMVSRCITACTAKSAAGLALVAAAAKYVVVADGVVDPRKAGAFTAYFNRFAYTLAVYTIAQFGYNQYANWNKKTDCEELSEEGMVA